MPPESPQGLTTTQLVVISVLAGLLAGGVAATIDHFFEPDITIEKPRDDDQYEGGDERPPIIINNSSVILHPKKKGGGYTKEPGEWVPIAGSEEKSYRHDSDYVPPSMLRVKFVGPPMKEDCTRSDLPGSHFKTPISGTSFTLSYKKPDGTDEKITLGIDGNHLRADFPEKPTVTAAAVELERPAGQEDWTLVMDKWTCTFDVQKADASRKPILHVYQLK